MGLRSEAEYREGLRDGREVYFRGQRVDDVTKHPIIGVGVRHCSIDFRLAEDAEHRDLFTYELPEGGRASRYYKVPAAAEDLLDRNRMIETGTRLSLGVVPLVKEIGTDALFALLLVTREMDRRLGTKYRERVQRYLERAREMDLALAVAQTDVKGDRRRRPSQQSKPDYYVRIVRKTPDGIVIRGAKAHTTNTPFADEILVIPTRAMMEEDSDYAVACAVPVNARGVRLIVSPFSPEQDSLFHHPVSARHRLIDTLTIFDDVFVPWDRVFLCGEAAFAGPLANTFVEFHRFTAISYKPPLLDLLIGAAALIADFNGVLGAPHIQEKLTRLAIYTETIRALTRQAAMEPKFTDGVAIPRTLVTNMCKYYFATQYHQMISLVQDIAGGLLVTGPSEEDLRHPVLRQDIATYLGGREGAGARERLQVFNLIRDLTASDFGGYNEVLQIHAEGSIEAQKITIWREFDLDRCVELARQAVNLDGQEQLTPA
ncbi:MAG: hypothetical protein H0Z37_04305 [Firmicutes bacterium]|nr:hypothetical protein [Bacillota bacterium]